MQLMNGYECITMGNSLETPASLYETEEASFSSATYVHHQLELAKPLSVVHVLKLCQHLLRIFCIFLTLDYCPHSQTLAFNAHSPPKWAMSHSVMLAFDGQLQMGNFLWDSNPCQGVAVLFF